MRLTPAYPPLPSDDQRRVRVAVLRRNVAEIDGILVNLRAGPKTPDVHRSITSLIIIRRDLGDELAALTDFRRMAEREAVR